LLLRAARQLEAYDPRLARDTYLDAVNAAMFATPSSTGDAQLQTALAARSAPPSADPPSPGDLLLDGVVTLIIEGHEAGVPRLRTALETFRSSETTEDEALRWFWLADIMAASLWDIETCVLISDRHIRIARNTGRPTTLPLALTTRVAAHVVLGELTAAETLTQEVEGICEVIGASYPPYAALLVAAWQGKEEVCAELMGTAVVETTRLGEGGPRIVGGWAMALLHNSAGRYDRALDALVGVVDHGQRDVGTVGVWALVEYVEAAVRAGVPGDAAEAFGRLVERTRPSGTEWALGVEARCRALLAEGGEAEGYYREAVERLGCTGVRGELARARLLYGEWLRRERRQWEAREQLRAAHEEFSAMGMEAFARRAERELQATGERTRSRGAEASNDLTSQEAQIVRLVREGLTNAEIGARIFISPRTVEWHLRNIFPKLGVTSRRQLQRAQQGTQV
ncbi:LuxR C-terminal-related transcriptional regulator, partial [Streptomyces sp. NPDC013178]|uniref:helix-turn-helix transcriptional regulator n=1 Tax=Streptomyces sp. NPDC013178 TaxID=3155118 RepID=UPI003404702A